MELETVLELKKYSGIFQVIGKYPAGMGGLKDDEYVLGFEGGQIRLKKEAIDLLFKIAFEDVDQLEDLENIPKELKETASEIEDMAFLDSNDTDSEMSGKPKRGRKPKNG